MADRFSKPLLLAQVLKKNLKSLSIHKKLKDYEVITQWETVVGKAISQHAAAKKIVQNTLFVEVNHPTWHVELKMMEPEILKKISSFHPKTPITKIHFKLKTE